MAEEKNERVLHTRIPESLEKELRDKASSLGMSMSNLVRNILNNAVDLVEDIITDSSRVARYARTAKGDGAAAPKAPEPTAEPVAPVIIGWHTVVLQRNAICDRCNSVLTRGAGAALSVTDPPTAPTILCVPCMEAETHES